MGDFRMRSIRIRNLEVPSITIFVFDVNAISEFEMKFFDVKRIRTKDDLFSLLAVLR